MNIAEAQSRQELLLQKGWKFSKGDFAEAMHPLFNDATWQDVQVPHDWAIYGPFDRNNDIQTVKVEQDGEIKPAERTGRTGALPYMGVGWYRIRLPLDKIQPNQKVSVLFDGAMSNAKVFINGQEIGGWPYGYASFHFDITPWLKSDQPNFMAVRLENKPLSSRWYPGAGLYRNVRLIVTNKHHIKTWGTFVTTPIIKSDKALVNIVTECNLVNKARAVLVTEIWNNKGELVAKDSSGHFFDGRMEQQLYVKDPVLWSIEAPTLYVATSKLYLGNQLTDIYTTRFGIRKFKFEPGKGFLLNDKPFKFKGVCNHHDLGPLGAAINKTALKRQLLILKDMGCNAIRTAHNPPAPELLDLCDEMGFLVMNEAFDEWVHPKMENGYHRLFKDWAEKDLVSFIHRDRNHPSVVLWSIGNEIREQNRPEGNKVAAFLVSICHREDPTRYVTAGMNNIDEALKNNFASIMDVPGFNYKPFRYPEAYTKLPQGIILGSETASTVSSRGVYKFPVQLLKQKVHSDGHSSSYDLEHCNWSQVPDDEFVMQDSLPYVGGEFVWTGFDYLGEPTPYNTYWPSRSSYFGIIDLAGIPKDRYYLYRSRWNPEKETLHILPHWNWKGREGQITPVFCYTNYPSAELFVNGKSQGVRSKNNTTYQSRYRLMWDSVKYEPGILRIVAYDANGNVVASKELHTAGKPYRLELTADAPTMDADINGLSFITVKAVDKEGNLVPDAMDEVSFRVTGTGFFRASCNGDPTSLAPFHKPVMKLFNGMLVAIVQSNGEKGKVTFEAKAKGLKGQRIIIECK